VERNVCLDIAKAICIVLVVIGHYFPADAPMWYVNFRFLIYTFHMPLFLFASGYIYQSFKKEESYMSFVMKKMRRLMVPYLATSVVIITIKLFTQSNLYVEHAVTWFSYVRMFYMPEAGYFLWFVWSLFSMFLIAPLLKTKAVRLSAFFIALLIHYLPFDQMNVFALSETKRMFMWFMLGVFCCDLRIQEKIDVLKRKKYFLYLVIVVAFGFLATYDMREYASCLSWLGIALVMVAASLLEKLPKRNGLMGALLTLSTSSYIIYLFHTTFEGFAKSIVNKLSDGEVLSQMEFFFSAIIVISCGVLFPILLHKFVLVRNSCLKFLFGL